MPGKGAKERREKIPSPPLELRGDRCEECGETTKAEYDKDGFLVRRHRSLGRLTFHHKDHNPANNDPSNLQTLCRKCHDKKH